MHAKHWLIGFALCITGIGSAAATNLDTQDMDASPHANVEGSGRDGGSSGGDALGLSRDCPQHSTSSDSSGNNSSNSNDRSGGAASAPVPTRQRHLGWQSLLPGSIQ